MLRLVKSICWLTMFGFGVQNASAFSLLGPRGQATGTPDGYQQAVIAYQLPGDIGTPKNLGEEYRRNTPVMYYTMDANFLDYFGANGSNAIVQSFEIMNALTNVSSYSGGLSEFPMEAQEYNFQAQALQLLDLKSTMMSLIVEQLGLSEPDRWTWTLRDRVMGSPCPQAGVYTLVQRNFDPVWSTPDHVQTSSYVNGTLYTYYIYEFCTGPNPLADAVEFRVDPLAGGFTAVAAGFSIDFFNGGIGLDLGGFYTGLTRDDVGGLRYLWRTNNMNVEDAGPDTFTFLTNNTTFQLLFTSNLTLFAEQALTNDAAGLLALYPNLIITSTTPIFTNIVTTNQVAYFMNSPYQPAGSPATLVTNTVLTTNVVTWFRHQFANVITNIYFTNGVGSILTTNISTTACSPYVFPGTICTNISFTPGAADIVGGDFFILPTNMCSVKILSTQLIQTVFVTNLLAVATNAPGTTNVSVQEFSQSLVYSYNQYVFIINPVECPTNSTALRQGVEKISFVRRDYDSLLHRFFYPVTNRYTLYAVTNNTLMPQQVERVITAPDFLITASDIGDQDPGNNVLAGGAVARSIVFDATNVATAYPNLAGPGTISRPAALFAPGTVFDFQKMGPYYLNQFSGFFFGSSFIIASELNQFQILVWGSFDGSTNAPVVYPNGTSITNLENSVLIQVNPSTPVTNGVVQLPNGTVGVDYSAVFTGFSAVGGQPPYSWSLAPGSPGLPPELVLNPNGTMAGAPDAGTAGLTFDFVIRMTDAGSRFVDRPYTITINP